MAHQNSSTNDTERKIITKGYLMKQGNLLNKSFKKKYFILYQGRILTHFETKACVKQSGEIDLAQVSQITYRENIKTTSKCKYAFDVIADSKTWTLGSVDQCECDQWINHLRESAFGNMLFDGWLHKRGGKVQTWKHRFFVLSDTKILRYYEDEEGAKYKGCIFLNDVIKIQTGDPLPEHNNIIYLTTPSRIWCISAESKESQQEWIEKLNDGQNQINYDEKASIFVHINKHKVKCRGNIDNGTCLAIDRIKFVCCIYLKWIKSHKTQQYKDKHSFIERTQSAVQYKRASTTKIQSYSISDEKLPELRARSTDLFAMKMKYKLRKGVYSIINNDLKEYSNKELLNDFNHILEQHHTTKKFELLYKYLRQDANKDASDEKDIYEDEELLPLFRIYRSRSNYSTPANLEERDDLYFRYHDVCEIATQQLLDKIYCDLFHSFNVCRLRKREMNEVQAQRKKSEKNEDTYIDCKERVLSNTKRLLRHKRKILIDAVKNHKLQLRDNKFVALPSKIEANEANNDGYHAFGDKSFFYWESCKNEALYVAAKYDNLKYELLNNSLCRLSLPQYDTIYYKANDLHKTDRALIIGAFCGWKIGSGIQGFVQRYGIDEGTPIKIHHILTSIIYCNYYQLTESYRSTYQDINGSKHNEFAHFSRYLVECVLVFGASVTNKMSLYHAMNEEDIILHDLSVKYIAPISMTEYFEVACSYSDSEQDGVILKLTQQDNLSAFNMDCCWLSDFVFESERIIIANTEAMRVDAIIHRKQYANYSVYIHAINALSNLLSSNKPLYIINEVTKRALNKIITYKFNKHKLQKDEDKQWLVPPYIDTLFEKKCLMMTDIECDCRQICQVMNKDNDDNNGCYSIFRSLLVDPGYDWIKIDLFVMLFPNLNSVTIRCFNHLTFNKNTASQLFNVFKSRIVRKKHAFRVEWMQTNECEASYLDTIKMYYKPFERLNYQMINVNESIIFRKEHKKRKSKKNATAVTVNAAAEKSVHDNDDQDMDDTDCIIM